MLDDSLIAQWLQRRSDLALKKLLENEPLTFEDDIVMAMIGQREEMKRLETRLTSRIDQLEQKTQTRFERIEDQITDLQLSVRDIQADVKEIRRGSDDVRKEIINQTRWFIGGVAALAAFIKILDILFK